MYLSTGPDAELRAVREAALRLGRQGVCVRQLLAAAALSPPDGANISPRRLVVVMVASRSKGVSLSLSQVKNVVNAVRAHAALRRQAPAALGERLDAFLWKLTSDLPSTIAMLLRFIRLLIALKCLKWTKLFTRRFTARA